jgi:hypothetical protein
LPNEILILTFLLLKCQCQTFHFVYAQLELEWTSKLHDTYINVSIGNDKELAMLSSSLGVFPTMDTCINLGKIFHTLGKNPNSSNVNQSNCVDNEFKQIVGEYKLCIVSHHFCFHVGKGFRLKSKI